MYSRENKALCSLHKYKRRLDKLPINISLTPFNKIELPILHYGCEIWGHTDCDAVECVHLKLCERLLGVGSTTSDVAVLGDLGRSPLAIHYKMWCAKYWLKLLNLPHRRISKVYYQMLNLFMKMEHGKYVNIVRHIQV